MSNNDILILITGEKLTGWTSCRLTKSLDRLAGKFQLSMVNEEEFLTFVDTQRISQLFIGEDKVLTGYIDRIDNSLTKDENKLTIAGREITADLVDCSAVNKPGTWNDIKFERLLESLLAPDPTNNKIFNIETVIQAEITKSVKKFSINTGDTVFDAISKLCALYNVIPVTNSEGELVIVGADIFAAVDPLVLGENLMEVNGVADYTGRFSEYSVKGQLINKGEGWSQSNISSYGEAFDENVERFRPLQIKADDNVDNALAKDRAAWDAQIRAGRSQTTTCTVSEWRQSDGTLWEVNTLVPVIAKPARLEDVMLITNVSFELDEKGRKTIIQLAPPEIFKPKPEPVIKKATKKTGWA